VHTRTSGVTDHLADDDRHALAIAREIVRHARGANVQPVAAPAGAPADPHSPSEELYGVIPADPRQPFDVREIIARLVDGSDFHEFKALYAPPGDRLRAHPRYPVGILANNGILFSESALKGTHFIEALLPAAASPSSSCRTSPASWWAESTKAAASRRMARRW
jgi:3-methylcrotonyl-CoA carboxylase beta subunit